MNNCVRVVLWTLCTIWTLNTMETQKHENTRKKRDTQYLFCYIKGDDGSISVTSSARPFDGRHDTPFVPFNAPHYADGCQWPAYLSPFFDGIMDAAKNRELYRLARFRIIARPTGFPV